MTLSPGNALDFETAPEPPWRRYPDREPWWGGWRQGDAEPWYALVFLPFWIALAPDQRRQYLERFPAPTREWTEYLADYAARGSRTSGRVPDFTSAPPPPWKQYPGRGPLWIGWHVGKPKRWLQHTFLVYWLPMPPEDQNAYLELWPAPNEPWRRRMRKWQLGG
jgi:hypothetical protein